MLWLGLLTALLGVLLVSCGKSPSASPQTKGPAQATARRIAVLSPAIAVMLKDLGFEDRVVARHTWDLVLSDSVPAIGDQFELDYEALLAINPTHVYTQYESAGVPDRLRELAEQHGWHLEDYRINTLEQIAQTLDDLYLDLGGQIQTDRELRVNGISVGGTIPEFADSMPSDRLAQAWGDRGPSVRGAGRVLLLAQGETPAALGPGSVHHEILVSLGGTPAIESGQPWMNLDAEDVLRLAPDAIVIFAPRERTDDEQRWPTTQGPEWDDLAKRLGAFADLPIPAIENQRVLLVDHPLCLLPSPSLGEVAEVMAEQLIEWAE
ncbi:MAG: ABC-type hemin transport system substrate-binding protein [Phycisphaerales bacterium]|jgi:ABC-type hemin transport system substrate-binding protein